MHTPILQFGTSRFLQAHADLFVSEAMARNEATGGITVVQTTASAERSHRLAALAAPGGFPVRIRGKKDGTIIDATTQVQSVLRAISAVDAWDETTEIFARQASIVFCNTADKGYDISGEADALPAGVPESFPGKLTKLLRSRFERTGQPLTILPAELISRNGDTLSAVVTVLSERWGLGARFQDWLEHHVVFSNTLVDRIVSEPIEPAGAIAEPYALWAIERRGGQTLPCRHPAMVVSDDIAPYENLKLFILNLGHTWLTQGWLQSGLAKDMTVREILSDAVQRGRLIELYQEDILPGFEKMGLGSQAVAYIAETIERFENPFLNHRLADIAQNHAEKIRRRAGGFLAWSDVHSRRLNALLAAADERVDRR